MNIPAIRKPNYSKSPRGTNSSGCRDCNAFMRTIRSMASMAPAVCLPILLAAAALPTGCATRGEPEQDTAQEQQERINRFLRRIRDPRVMGLVVYDSDHGPVFDNAFRIHPNQVAHIPWGETGSGAPVIEASIGNRTVRTLLDTTASSAWMKFDAAERCELIAAGPPLHAKQPAHVAPETEAIAAIANRISLDNVYIETGVFFVSAPAEDLTALLRDTRPNQPEAVLGWQMLRRFRIVQFDWPRQTVSFSTSTAYEPREELLVGRTTLHSGGPVMFVDGAINGRHQRILLDTGGDFKLAMRDAPAEQVRQLSIGDVVFRQVDVTPLEETELALTEYPRIGLQLLRRYKVTIDNRMRIVYFERPDED